MMNRNLKRGQKFLMSGMIFGFCMARTVACIMRIVSATRPQNISIAIAAQIFVAAGVIILFIVNMIFVQRVIRASHPHIGWAKTFSLAFKLFIASIIIILIALITCTIQSFFTLNKNTRRIDRDIQWFGSTYFAVTAFLPLVLLALRAMLPNRGARTEKFGTGRFRTKIIILVISASLLTLGAAFRAGVGYMPRPRDNPAWYHSKACFYLFNFTIEWVVVALYAIIRVDKRFIVPNKSKGPGDYSRKVENESDEKTNDQPGGILNRVLSEEEVFDGEVPEEDKRSHSDTDVEAQHESATRI